MKHRIIYIASLVALLLLSACDKGSDYIYPSVILDFLNATTNSKGAVDTIATDNNLIYKVDANYSKVTLTANTTQRVIAYYSVNKQATGDSVGSANIHSMAKIISSVPRVGNYVWSKDPVTIQSVWKSGHWINLTLGIKMLKGNHYMAFIQGDNEIINSQRVITVEVSHDKNGDTESFTNIVYMSIPLSQYETAYPTGFTINVLIPTSSGITTYTFTD